MEILTLKKDLVKNIINQVMFVLIKLAHIILIKVPWTLIKIYKILIITSINNFLLEKLQLEN